MYLLDHSFDVFLIFNSLIQPIHYNTFIGYRSFPDITIGIAASLAIVKSSFLFYDDLCNLSEEKIHWWNIIAIGGCLSE